MLEILCFFIEIFGGTAPGWLVTPRTRWAEKRALRQFLQGDNPKTSGMRFQVTDGPVRRVSTNNGAYHLLHRVGAEKMVYLLGMDKPIARIPIDYWRKSTLRVAKSAGVELLPVSEKAYQKACESVGGDAQPRLVDRQGYEAVFTLSDGKSEHYYLSGYDKQEYPPLYFLCELPHAVDSVRAARLALQPPSVKTALKHRTAVDRQGDLFFIHSQWTNKAILDAGGTIDNRMYAVPLYGTAHTAGRVATLPNGVMLARGVVRHAPSILGQRREADHKDRFLKPGWWVVARNTVPAQPSKRVAEPVGVAPFSDPFWALD